MLSAKLRAALDNLLPHEGEDEAYLGTPTLRDAAVLIAFTDRPDPSVILTQRPQWQIGRAHVCTPVSNSHIVCRLLLDKKNEQQSYVTHATTVHIQTHALQR